MFIVIPATMDCWGMALSTEVFKDVIEHYQNGLFSFQVLPLNLYVQQTVLNVEEVKTRSIIDSAFCFTNLYRFRIVQ